MDAMANPADNPMHGVVGVMCHVHRRGGISNGQAWIVGHLSLHESTHPCSLCI